MPVEILVREIMEQARSIDDVVALVKKTPVMVPDFYLVGDGKTGESAVLERTPRRLEVRRSNRADGTMLLANHALAQTFAADAENDRLKRYLTSGARYRRVEELVKHWRGQIDPKKALEILRDKRGGGNADRTRQPQRARRHHRHALGGGRRDLADHLGSRRGRTSSADTSASI